MVKRKTMSLVLFLLMLLSVFNIYPYQKASAYDYLSRGIDVSAYQGSIDWNAVANDGIYFAIIRSGLGKYDFQEDKYFRTNYANAKSVGIKVGTYWVSYAMSVDEAYEEADVCYSIIIACFALEIRQILSTISYVNDDPQMFLKMTL